MDEPAAREGEGGGSSWALVALLLLAAAALFVIQMRRSNGGGGDPLVGQPLPPLDAAGWLNTERPLTAGDLAGKIVVLDFWATWCPPCARSLPHLVEFHKKYQGQGVVLIGLTEEPANMLPEIRQFNERVEGVNWPIAYGAAMAVQMLEIPGWPTYILYDRSGVSVWSGISVAELEDEVVAQLAKNK